MARSVTWARVAGALGRALIVVLATAVVAWLMAEAAPGSVAERAARTAGVLPGDDTAAPHVRQQIIDRVADDFELGGSTLSRLGGYIGGLVTFDFGRSWRDGAAVRPQLTSTTAATLARVLLALLLAVLVGVLAAVAAARRPGSTLDVALATAAALTVALPPVWVAILLLRSFAAGQPWAWFPLDGGWLLPVFTLSLVPAFVIARHLRGALIERAAEPWAVAAVARGVSRERVIRVHALRVATPALLPILVTLLAYLLGTSLVVEEVFGIRGLGHLVVDASTRGDAPVVVGASVVVAALLATTSAIIEAVRPLIDPRIGQDHAA